MKKYIIVVKRIIVLQCSYGSVVQWSPIKWEFFHKVGFFIRFLAIFSHFMTDHCIILLKVLR